MPKIECNEKLFFDAIGKKYTYDVLEDILPCAKAELDEKPDMSQPENERVVKIELNDTNRPDLWSGMPYRPSGHRSGVLSASICLRD